MLSLSGGPFGSSLVCGCASQLATLMYPIPPTDSTLALGAPRVLPRSRSLSLSLALSLSSAASLPPCVTERRRLRSWYYSIDMASIASASHVVAPAAFAAAVPRVATSESSPVRAFTGLRSAPLIARESAEQSLGVQNGSRVSCMQVHFLKGGLWFFFFLSQCQYYFSLVLLFCERRFALWWAVWRLWECRVWCRFWGDLFLQVWAPTGNKKFETLSYLPPLTNDQIAKQIDYMLSKNLIPCLEFDLVSAAVFLEIALCRLQWSNGSNDWPFCSADIR